MYLLSKNDDIEKYSRRKLTMPLKLLNAFAFCILVFSGTFFIEAREHDAPLTGQTVARITQQFAAIHYAKKPIDDEISRKMLNTYLSRLDPGHYYFRQADIDEFLEYEYRLDDLLEQGDIELALHIFKRFKTRIAEHLEYIEILVNEEFDFDKDASLKIDRDQEPYPDSLEAAQKLWRLKFKFDLLTLVIGGDPQEEAKNRLLQRAQANWKNFSQFTDNNVLSLYLNAFTSGYDPHSSYMEPHDQKNFEINIRLSLEGIGAVLRWDNGYTVVNSIVPGGAAFREGSLRVNDRILAVAQGDDSFESVVDVRLNDVVQLIRGKRGTKVRLQVLRKTEKGDSIVTIAIIREKIVLKDGEAKSYLLTPDSPESENFRGPEEYTIGLIHLPSFYTDFEGRRKNQADYKSATRDVKKILEQFNSDKVDGVVLDLRNNGGGGLLEAVNMVGLFVGKKPAVMVRNTFGEKNTRRSQQSQVYHGPLLILLNHYSASASEILAGALQDYGRAILIGDKSTFGKGTVQNIANLPDKFGALKITIAQFYRVSGGSTQNMGVVPDIVLPSINNHMEIGESHLENALPWKKIKSLDYKQDQTIQNYLPALIEQSQKRINEHPLFQEVEKEIDEYLNHVKPKEYTTILGIQEEFRKDEAQSIEDRVAMEKRIIDAQEENLDGSQDKVKDTPTPSALADIEYSGKNIYLEESVFILEDFIRYLETGGTKLSQN